MIESIIEKYKDIGYHFHKLQSGTINMSYFVSSLCQNNHQIRVAKYLKYNNKQLKRIFNDVEKTDLFS